MAITFYTGLPGHGKSYGVVENVIAPALKKNRTVYTNIPMKDDECLSRFGITVVPFKTQDILDNPNWWTDVFVSGSVLVIDEAWRLWASGLKSTAVRVQDKTFLAEHRHMVGENGLSTEVIFVCQDISQMAKFVIELTETTFRVTKLSNIGLNSRFRVDVYRGGVGGQRPPEKLKLREIQGKFKKEIYALYQSHTKSETGEAGDETRTDDRFNALKGVSIKIGIVAVIVCIIFVFYGFSDVKEKYAPSKPQQSVPSTENVVKAPVITSQNKIVPPKKKVFSFLSSVDSISIVMSNGHYPNVEYRYKVVASGHESTFTSKELMKLKYNLRPINDCMVIIEGQDFIGYAMCETEIKQDWADSFINQKTSDLPT